VSRANLPAAPCVFENTGDVNVSAPDGEVVPPGGLHALNGLTIREEFAKAAMAAIIANGRTSRGGSASIVLDVATEAREYADAMIDELEREPRK
jgi:hypothetical protein